MKYLTDATWAVDYLAGVPTAVSLQPTLAQDGLGLSIITYTELWEGVLFTQRDPKAASRGLREFLSAISVLPYSRRVALRAASLRGKFRQRGGQVHHRALDLLVAATALHYGLVLVTSDKDFEDISGLTRLDPRTGAIHQNPT
jgi:predicted nucleic acid-binding protein